MPKGVRLRTRRKVPKNASYHSFIVTKEDGSRVNGSALTYYEVRRRDHPFESK